jgi:hypothetical protein
MPKTRAVIDGKFCIDLSRDKYWRYIDISTLTIDTMKNIYICVINWDHGVMHVCINTHYKHYNLPEVFFSLLFLSTKVQVNQEN